MEFATAFSPASFPRKRESSATRNHVTSRPWIPAFAGMTKGEAGMTKGSAGMTDEEATLRPRRIALGPASSAGRSAEIWRSLAISRAYVPATEPGPRGAALRPCRIALGPASRAGRSPEIWRSPALTRAYVPATEPGPRGATLRPCRIALGPASSAGRSPGVWRGRAVSTRRPRGSGDPMADAAYASDANSPVASTNGSRIRSGTAPRVGGRVTFPAERTAP